MGTLLCDSGLGLKLQGRVRHALISPLLRFDQVFSCALLEQMSGLETDRTAVGMSFKVLDHGTPSNLGDASPIFELVNLRRHILAAFGETIA